MRKEPVWSEIRSEFINEEGFLCIDAWKTANDEEEGKVIAYIDTLGGRVIYVDPMARIDENAQEIILAKSREYQKEHPFNVDELEVLAKGVVNFESEESASDGYQNLEAMGFSQAEMKFFGFDVDGALKELESEYEGGEE